MGVEQLVRTENEDSSDDSSDVLRKEEEFHDQWANSISVENVMVTESFEACTAPENRIILEKLGDVYGKRLLELGCGAGEASIYFAKLGAEVTATDISAGMLKVVKDVAAYHGVAVDTRQLFSHNLPFMDGEFDIVYAANLLHHVELEQTLAEARRVLRDGGIFVCWDPLAHNPLINVYRRMATQVRTVDEHPLKMDDLKRFRAFFPQVAYETTWFFTLWIFFRFYLIEQIDPNKERYWKKILLEHKRLEPMYCGLELCDRFILRLFPFLKRYCWNIVIICKKT